MLKIPSFFFPTTVIILDDDRYFSQMLKQCLQEHFHIKTFTHAHEVEPYVSRSAVCMEAIAHNYFPLSNEARVKAFIESGLSHNLVSVLITDYQLDGRDGIEFLDKLNPPFVQRVLISNFIDPNVVNAAYKNKTINAYLPKLDSQFIEKLKDTINEMQKRFFIDYCQQITDSPLQYSKLSDHTFANFINRIVSKFEITQMVSSPDLNFFQLESDKKRQKINLHVAEDQDFEDFINSMHGEKAPPAVLSRIKQRLAIPCYTNRKIPDGSLWAEYLKPVIAIHGQKSYYISCYSKNEGISLHAI